MEEMPLTNVELSELRRMARQRAKETGQNPKLVLAIMSVVAKPDEDGAGLELEVPSAIAALDDRVLALEERVTELVRGNSAPGASSEAVPPASAVVPGPPVTPPTP
jgi:hypothetical protein